MATHAKNKSRKDSGGYKTIPDAVIDSDSYRMLSGNATKLLWCIFRQYNGSNNGDLSAPYSLAERWNINSQTTWYKVIAELIEANLILCTRESANQNPHGQCKLFAVTWLKIHECKGKIDCKPTAIAPRSFSMKPKQ